MAKDNKKPTMQQVLAEFENISAERKRLVAEGEVPEWYITQGYMMFTRKYSYLGETVRGAFTRVANHLAQYVPHLPEAAEKFFQIQWKGHLAPSTPVLCNTGTPRGHSVSCSGGYIGDSVYEFKMSEVEAALLSQKGYGTSGYLSDIRHRGAPISTGGEASGAVEVFDSFLDMSGKISQGNNRRGQWAGYLHVDHADFWEMAGYVLKNTGAANIGWIFTDEFIQKLVDKDKEAIRRWNRVMYLRARTGKGYIWKIDTANRLAPLAIKNCGIPIRASNLCTEIALPQNEEYTYSCVLSSLNLSKWHEFDEDTIYWAHIFLDCVVSDTIKQTQGTRGLEKIAKFTEDFRAIGLGTLGWHTLLQKNMIPMESLEAQFLNTEIFRKIQEEQLRASRDLARDLGEPLMCKGTGLRNATNTAIAPNTSSALLCGGVSQGIEPLVANTYNQPTAAGEVTRMNPLLIELLKSKGIYSEELMRDIDMNFNGSIQHLDQLSDIEKLVFKTAFEIPQGLLVRLASQRQLYIDQAQSLNLFFDTDEQYIAEVTKQALLDPNIKSLYYQRSLRGVKASKGTSECVACHA